MYRSTEAGKYCHHTWRDNENPFSFSVVLQVQVTCTGRTVKNKLWPFAPLGFPALNLPVCPRLLKSTLLSLVHLLPARDICLTDQPSHLPPSIKRSHSSSTAKIPLPLLNAFDQNTELIRHLHYPWGQGGFHRKSNSREDRANAPGEFWSTLVSARASLCDEE